MNLFAWYLVISLNNSDELLVKEMPSKIECIKQQELFLKKIKDKQYTIDCQEGAIMEQLPAKNKEQTL
jgi:hypothetical protein